MSYLRGGGGVNNVVGSKRLRSGRVHLIKKSRNAFEIIGSLKESYLMGGGGGGGR